MTTVTRVPLPAGIRLDSMVASAPPRPRTSLALTERTARRSVSFISVRLTSERNCREIGPSLTRLQHLPRGLVHRPFEFGAGHAWHDARDVGEQRPGCVRRSRYFEDVLHSHHCECIRLRPRPGRNVVTRRFWGGRCHEGERNLAADSRSSSQADGERSPGTRPALGRAGARPTDSSKASPVRRRCRGA